jgi:hypothetical protein
MDFLEKLSDRKQCYFVDLFVRVSNAVAITMYKRLGMLKFSSFSCVFSLNLSFSISTQAMQFIGKSLDTIQAKKTLLVSIEC